MIYITAERFIPEVDKPTVRQLRQNQGLSQKQLADKADVSLGAIRSIEDESHRFCTSYEAALRVSNALGVELHRIRWTHGLSDVGRPVGTGRALSSVSRKAELCPVHFIALPATGICDDCS